MAIAQAEQIVAGLPAEDRLLEAVTVRLIQSDEERVRHDELLNQEHYLHNANAVGRVLRYVAEYRGHWVAVLTFCSAALHLKPRDRFLQWSAREVSQRRHLVAQNSRFLVLPATGRWPNLATRILKLACARLPADWQRQFGQPVLLVETFVDPQRFRGTCYKAAGWLALGQTKGFEHCGQDFYTDLHHPKELWVRPLGDHALAALRAGQLAPELVDPSRPAPPSPPVQDRPDELAVAAYSAAAAGPTRSPRHPARHRQPALPGHPGHRRRVAGTARHRGVCPQSQPWPTPPAALPATAGHAPGI